MSTILSIIAIFSFIIILFLASIKIIDLVFTAKKQLKKEYLRTTFTVISLFFWFIISAVSTIFISYFLFKLPQKIFNNSKTAISLPEIAKQDCQQLTNTIYASENRIHSLDNHRYLEEITPLVNRKLEYEKASKKLKFAANRYLKLNVTKQSQHYSQKIAQTLQEKAQLFEERTKTIKSNSTLVQKMDRLTEERKELINFVKKQCK